MKNIKNSKRFYVTLISMTIVILVLSLCACSSSADTLYTITKDEIEFTVDTESKTITDGVNQYLHNVTENTSMRNIEIIYPDGSSYWKTIEMNGNVSVESVGWSGDYNEEHYIDGDTLCDILPLEDFTEMNYTDIVISMLIFGTGVFCALCPKTAWYLERGWKYKNVEPSDLALGINRVLGVIFIVFSVVSLFL